MTALFLLAPPLGGESEAQKEVAIVQHKVDLNGDGHVDELRIDDLGIISVLITGSEDDGAWTPLAANGKIVGGSFRVDSQVDPSGRPLILAVAKLRRSKNQTYEEALVLSYSPGKLTTLWRGPQGSDEADGALRRFVELGDHGLIRYASRHGVFRCDGKTAHLDAKRYDFASNSFRPVKQAIRVPAGAPRLQALSANPATIPQDSRGFWFRPRGASSSLRATSPSQLVAPLAISDRNSKTAWVENKPGLGSGEFITMQSGLGAVHIKALRFELGHGGAAKGFRSPKKIGLLIGKEKAFWVDFPNVSSGTPLWVELPEPISASCVTVVLADSLTKNSGRGRGRGRGRTVGTTRTAISEISVLSSEELDTRRSSELLAEGIAAGRAKADTRRLLKNLGNKASSALLSVLKKTTNRRAQTRLRLALATIPAAPEELVLGLLNDSLGSSDYMLFGRALRKIGPASVPVLAAALARPGLQREGGKRVALMLQTMPGPEAKDALLNALGRGSDAQRKAVVRALGASPGAWPVLRQALAREQQPVAVKADLFRAAAVAAESFEPGSAERAEIGQTIAEALSAPTLAYELRYRLLQVAGNVGGAQATGALIGQYEAFEKHGAAADVSSQALTEVAAAALAQS
ncbi:MAG: HEAT repeat domain-containing protein, partial [Kofleriaceae bacterium]|nr:HEAT repeat domain-containing protein [Kofleriaceae bacterium]